MRDLSDKCAEAGLRPPSTSHLSQIERGRVTPRPPLRAVLAKLLDLDPVGDFSRQDEGASS